MPLAVRQRSATATAPPADAEPDMAGEIDFVIPAGIGGTQRLVGSSPPPRRGNRSRWSGLVVAELLDLAPHRRHRPARGRESRHGLGQDVIAARRSTSGKSSRLALNANSLLPGPTAAHAPAHGPARHAS